MRFRLFILIIIVGCITYLTYVFADELNDVSELVFGQAANPGIEAAEEDLGSNSELDIMYVSVLDHDPEYGYSFYEMNALSQTDSILLDPKLPVQLRMDPSDGGEHEVYGTIEQRGKSVRLADLKSYRIQFDKQEKMTWYGQTTLNLNKHPYDYTLVRNKLSYDYFQLIPNIFRSDTQFVHLFVQDMTAADGQVEEYVDYGLFTHVEAMDRNYLRRHGLDPDGYLYKAMNFEFYRYPDILRNRHDPLYDKEQFETVLSIRGREYHDKLLTMLDAVNNENSNIDRVFDRYFDEENFLTWIAVNILMGNLDTSGNNYYLYSSRFSDKWYFIPWDYDKAWGYDWQWNRSATSIHPTRQGLTLYWGWPLAKRYFQIPEHVELLNAKIEEIYQIMTKEQTKQFLDQYYPIAREYALREPDVQLLPDNLELFDEQYYSLTDIPEQNRMRYYEQLEKPAPIFIGGPWIDDDKMTFTWDKSYDFQGDSLVYDLMIAHDPALDSVVLEEKGIEELEYTTGKLPPGEYYWTVLIRDDRGNVQIPFESYIDGNGRFYHGVKMFTIS